MVEVAVAVLAVGVLTVDSGVALLTHKRLAGSNVGSIIFAYADLFVVTKPIL